MKKRKIEQIMRLAAQPEKKNVDAELMKRYEQLLKDNPHLEAESIKVAATLYRNNGKLETLSESELRFIAEIQSKLGII